MAAATKEPETATDEAPEKTNGVPKVESPDFYRRKLSREMRTKRHELRRAQIELDKLKDQTKEHKTRVDRLSAEYDEIAQDLEDLENGCYTPPELRPDPADDDDDSIAGEGLQKAAEMMHQRQGGGKPFDAGAQAPIEALLEFGLTAKQVEKIVDSELASTVGEIKTVGHLEKAIRENGFAHRMVKGIGETKWDKVTDALVAFRAKNPVPSDEPEPLSDERAFVVEAGEAGGGVSIVVGKGKSGFVAEARWTFEDSHELPRAGEGDTQESAIRNAVKRVLAETREDEDAPDGWIADLESWIRRSEA